MTTMAGNMERIIKAKKLRRNKLAELLNVSPQFITRMIQGADPIPPKDIPIILEFLGVDRAELDKPILQERRCMPLVDPVASAAYLEAQKKLQVMPIDMLRKATLAILETVESFERGEKYHSPREQQEMQQDMQAQIIEEYVKCEEEKKRLQGELTGDATSGERKAVEERATVNISPITTRNIQ